MMHDIGPGIPNVSFDYFCKYLLLPQHSKVTIDKVILYLQESGEIAHEGRWKAFPDDLYTHARKMSASNQ
jgi:hypothetical protein